MNRQDTATLETTPSLRDGPALASRIIVGTLLLSGMVLLWAGSVVHYGNGDASDPAALLADVHAYPTANVVKAVSGVASMTCFLIAGVGLTAIVRGRGRASTVGVTILLALGAASHLLGASVIMFLAKVTSAGMAPSDELTVATQLVELQNIYFFGLIPFLLAVLLLPAALWRARMVSWIPFALIVADLTVIGQFTGDLTPASLVWWIDPVISIAAYTWLAVGIIRYHPASESTPAYWSPTAGFR